ncbi:MAG: FAD:protein FMN transferase [Pseudomonadota bacterium]
MCLQTDITFRNRYKPAFLVSLLLPIIVLCSCEQSRSLHKSGRLLMGTFVEVSLAGPDDAAKEAAAAVMREIQRVEELTSFHKASALSAVNDAAGKGPVKCDKELLAIIRRALDISRRSDGAFDPTVGPLTKMWGFSGGEPRVPEPEHIREALPKVGWHLVKVDEAAGTVELPMEGMSLDLGGIAKGYALERAVEVIARHNIPAALINAGGDITAVGEKEPGKPWRVGVQDPRDRRAIRAVVELKDRSIVTSGDYERFLIKDDRRYHHILNPKTGYPVEGIRSVTIMTSDRTIPDGLAAAVFVLGTEKGLKLAESMPGVYCLIIDAEDRVSMSPGAAELFQLR